MGIETCNTPGPSEGLAIKNSVTVDSSDIDPRLDVLILPIPTTFVDYEGDKETIVDEPLYVRPRPRAFLFMSILIML